MTIGRIFGFIIGTILFGVGVGIGKSVYENGFKAIKKSLKEEKEMKEKKMAEAKAIIDSMDIPASFVNPS